MRDILPIFILRVVLRLLTVFLRAVFLRGDLLLLGAALLFTLRRRVVFLRLGAAFLLVVFLLRVVLLLLGAAFLLVVFLRVVLLLLGAAFLLVVFFLRVVFLLLGAAFLRVVFLRVVLLLLGAAFLRVVLRRRVVLLLLGAAFRRATLLTDFLLAILFIPFLFDRTLFFRLAFFLLTALRLAAGRRGFSITTSARGIRSVQRTGVPHIRSVYRYMLLSYIYRLKQCSEKRDKYVYDAQYVSRRQAERDYSRRIPVSFTMEKELYDMVDDLIDRKVFKDRTHALNAAVDYLKWTLQNNPMLFYGPRNKQ